MTGQAILELPLDDDLFKVLSSDTRREILRLLLERRMTGTELAGRLSLGKPAVAEHLKRLSDADLIIRHDDPERRWVYYELSQRGRTILEPQRVRFYLVMAAAAAAVLVGVILVLGVQFLVGGAHHTGSLGAPQQGNGDGMDGFALPPGLDNATKVPATSTPTPRAMASATPGPSRPAAAQPAAPASAGVNILRAPLPTSHPVVVGVAPRPPVSHRVSLPLGLLNTTWSTAGNLTSTQYILTPELLDTVNGTLQATIEEMPRLNLTAASKSAVATNDSPAEPSDAPLATEAGASAPLDGAMTGDAATDRVQPEPNGEPDGAAPSGSDDATAAPEPGGLANAPAETVAAPATAPAGPALQADVPDAASPGSSSKEGETGAADAKARTGGEATAPRVLGTESPPGSVSPLGSQAGHPLPLAATLLGIASVVLMAVVVMGTRHE